MLSLTRLSTRYHSGTEKRPVGLLVAKHVRMAVCAPGLLCRSALSRFGNLGLHRLLLGVARLELAGDPLTIQVEGRLTTVKSESGLVYLILCEQPDPRVLCVTYEENGRKPEDIVVVSGAAARSSEHVARKDGSG